MNESLLALVGRLFFLLNVDCRFVILLFLTSDCYFFFLILKVFNSCLPAKSFFFLSSRFFIFLILIVIDFYLREVERISFSPRWSFIFSVKCALSFGNIILPYIRLLFLFLILKVFNSCLPAKSFFFLSSRFFIFLILIVIDFYLREVERISFSPRGRLFFLLNVHCRLVILFFLTSDCYFFFLILKVLILAYLLRAFSFSLLVFFIFLILIVIDFYLRRLNESLLALVGRLFFLLNVHCRFVILFSLTSDCYFFFLILKVFNSCLPAKSFFFLSSRFLYFLNFDRNRFLS